MTDVTATDASLSVGIKFYLADATGNTFTQIPGIKSPGVTGDKGTFVDATPIDVEGFKYIPALSEGEDRELTFIYYHDNTAQESLRTAAAAQETRKVKMEFTRSKKSAVFEMVLNGWALPEPEFNAATTMVVYAKKNTATPTVWSTESAK
ncbi:hypothetical protein [Endozoicomonas sp. Mp262]|uniref:hypothetical protein n=1 Tax=Endozoicomonas sp. Mp262 TaxID=2919499 RepID=UPI0021D7FCFE